MGVRRCPRVDERWPGGRNTGNPRCLCWPLYYNFGQMAKKIVFPIRMTDKQVDWIASQAGSTPPTTWARETILKDAPKEIREDKGEPLKPKKSA